MWPTKVLQCVIYLYGEDSLKNEKQLLLQWEFRLPGVIFLNKILFFCNVLCLGLLEASVI